MVSQIEKWNDQTYKAVYDQDAIKDRVMRQLYNSLLIIKDKWVKQNQEQEIDMLFNWYQESVQKFHNILHTQKVDTKIENRTLNVENFTHIVQKDSFWQNKNPKHQQSQKYLQKDVSQSKDQSNMATLRTQHTMDQQTEEMTEDDNETIFQQMDTIWLQNRTKNFLEYQQERETISTLNNWTREHQQNRTSIQMKREQLITANPVQQPLNAQENLDAPLDEDPDFKDILKRFERKTQAQTARNQIDTLREKQGNQIKLVQNNFFRAVPGKNESQQVSEISNFKLNKVKQLHSQYTHFKKYEDPVLTSDGKQKSNYQQIYVPQTSKNIKNQIENTLKDVQKIKKKFTSQDKFYKQKSILNAYNLPRTHKQQNILRPSGLALVQIPASIMAEMAPKKKRRGK